MDTSLYQDVAIARVFMKSILTGSLMIDFVCFLYTLLEVVMYFNVIRYDPRAPGHANARQVERLAARYDGTTQKLGTVL
jgi:hypothetical protein